MHFYQGPENDTWKIMPSSSRPSSIIISFSKGRTLSSGMLNLPGACFTDDTILCTTAQSVHNQCITWQTVATVSTPQWTCLLQSAVKIRARWLWLQTGMYQPHATASPQVKVWKRVWWNLVKIQMAGAMECAKQASHSDVGVSGETCLFQKSITFPSTLWAVCLT